MGAECDVEVMMTYSSSTSSIKVLPSRVAENGRLVRSARERRGLSLASRDSRMATHAAHPHPAGVRKHRCKLLDSLAAVDLAHIDVAARIDPD